jgi:hypothetical protein
MFRLILYDRSQISPATLYVQRLSSLSYPKENEKRNIYFIERSGKKSSVEQAGCGACRSRYCGRLS